MEEVIRQFLKKDELFSLYSNSEARDVFALGYLDDMDDFFLRLKCIDQNGFFDGHELIRLEGILRIEYGGKYERAIQILHSQRKSLFEQSYSFGHMENVFIETLRVSKKNNLPVKFCLDEDSEAVVGLIKKLKSGLVFISKIDEYGFDEGDVILKVEEIVKVFINSFEERNRLLLNSVRAKRSCTD